jgi:hypothetical protein
MRATDLRAKNGAAGALLEALRTPESLVSSSKYKMTQPKKTSSRQTFNAQTRKRRIAQRDNLISARKSSPKSKIGQERRAADEAINQKVQKKLRKTGPKPRKAPVIAKTLVPHALSLGKTMNSDEHFANYQRFCKKPNLLMLNAAVILKAQYDADSEVEIRYRPNLWSFLATVSHHYEICLLCEDSNEVLDNVLEGPYKSWWTYYLGENNFALPAIMRVGPFTKVKGLVRLVDWRLNAPFSEEQYYVRCERWQNEPEGDYLIRLAVSLCEEVERSRGL